MNDENVRLSISRQHLALDNTGSRGGIVAGQTELLLAVLASHIGAPVDILPTLRPTLFPAIVSRKSLNYGTNYCLLVCLL